MRWKKRTTITLNRLRTESFEFLFENQFIFFHNIIKGD